MQTFQGEASKTFAQARKVRGHQNLSDQDKEHSNAVSFKIEINAKSL